MKKLYFLLAILLMFSFASKAEELPPVEYGTDPYNYNYSNLRGNAQQQPAQAQQYNDPYQNNGEYYQQHPAAAQQPAPVQELSRDSAPKDPNSIDELLKAEHKFALLVPLTGKGADIGKALRDAALLAMAEKGSSAYAIIPIDTNANGPEAAAELAVSYHVEAILGPVFSEQVGKVANIARKNKLKVISFSNNKAIAGGGVYIFGLIPNQQVERMLLYAGNRGITNYSAIVPNNSYGHQVSEMVRKYAGWIGGNTREIGLYSANTKLSIAAGTISDAYKIQGAKPSLSKDAIVIPEGGAKLSGIVSALSNAGVGCGRVRCLGVASWDDKNIISSSALNGAWYASSPYEDVENFLSRFQIKYGYMPDEIATLGYDAASLAIEIAPAFSKAELERKSGYKGLKGIYRFTGDGINQRGYTIYEIRNGMAHVLDGAPNRF